MELLTDKDFPKEKAAHSTALLRRAKTLFRRVTYMAPETVAEKSLLLDPVHIIRMRRTNLTTVKLRTSLTTTTLHQGIPRSSIPKPKRIPIIESTTKIAIHNIVINILVI